MFLAPNTIPASALKITLREREKTERFNHSLRCKNYRKKSRITGQTGNVSIFVNG